MAELVAGFAGPAIELAKLVAKPIKRQFNYLCCFTSNIDSLIHQAQELDNAAKEMQDQVDIERINLKDAVHEVTTWLDECQKMKEQKETILQEVPNVKEGCLKLGARFSLSRRAQKMIDAMKELLVGKNFNPIAVERPRRAIQEVLLRKTCEFESRANLEEEIMSTLRNGDVNRIGICGMGGLGKTTMAKRIRNRVLEEHVFKEATLVVVSQQVDISKIQVEIGGSLGLKGLQHDTSEVRKVLLHDRLTRTGRILLILDGVWERLELEKLGIPRDSKGCTILVTSQNTNALSDMQKVFGMEILSNEEAWFLFRKTVGTCVDDTKLNPIARKVVEECDGLPIALITVGAALKDKKNGRIWNDALLRLERRCLGIGNYDARVYKSIKLSYDYLTSMEAKSLLLLCCLFPEDAEIPLEDLAYICMGLGVFEGIRNLEEARNRVSALTEMLTSRSLLLSDSLWNRPCVRMHDVVRDVCTKIAKNEKYIGGNDCAWYSSNEQLIERSEFRGELGFPNLRLLLLLKNEFKFDGVFLEGIRDLCVLWIKNSTLTSLPYATQPIKNLQTLVLESCDELKTISVVGELVNLKILVCRSCCSLEELPTEIKRLNRLKLLELVDCYSLQSIGRGIISSLVGLEELKMLGSFSKWEERKHAGLRELEALTNLTCLEIEIDDHTLVAENMHISKKLERFHINFGFGNYVRGNIYDKKMHLQLEKGSYLGDWIEMQLLRETEYLSLSGNGAMNVVNFGNCQKMRGLRLSECYYDDSTLFPATSSTSFQNLSFIEITYCPFLRNLAMLSIAGEDFLSQLEKIYIRDCPKMEQVLLWKEENNNSVSRIHSHVKFPKLKKVVLERLPNLATFCRGIEGIAFPQLQTIAIRSCPKWTSMVISNISSSSSNADIDDDYSSHLFCQPEKVSLGNLKELEMTGNPFCGHKIPESSFNELELLTIREYHGSRSLISSFIATNLANLMILRIDICDEMVQVVEDEDEEDKSRMANINGGERKTLLFPKLEELRLLNSPKLASFCELKCDVVSPSLRDLYINSCPKMMNFSIAAPNLKYFSTDFDHQLELRVGVSFDKLKKLWIDQDNRNTEYPFYHHKLFKSLVHGLEELELSEHRSMSLFPCSVAGELVNLRILEISDCDEMVKVIEEEAVEIASGGRRTLLFPKLEKLGLYDSPKLVCFCEGKSGVELPSLRKVVINGCRNMKRFSSGPLTAPNLKSIHTDYPRIGGEKDLNVVLQQRAKEIEEEEEEEKEKKNQQKKEEEEEEGGEEAHESKGEIEEERS